MLGKISSPKEWSSIGTAAQRVVESPSLEVFQNHGDVALRDTASGHGAGRLGLEIDNLSGLFQPQCSMKAEGCVNVHESQKTQKRKQS